MKELKLTKEEIKTILDLMGNDIDWSAVEKKDETKAEIRIKLIKALYQDNKALKPTEDSWREQLVKIVKEHSDEITMRYNIDGKITDARPMSINGEDLKIKK